jgi:hypothetical protein
MCVSAEASFGLTTLLTPVGAYCMRVAWFRDKTFLAVAAIPFLFGVQQFCEGLVWVGVGSENASLTRNASLGFLFFALAFWLFWIPFCSIFLDPRPQYRWILVLDTLVGLAGGVVLFLPLVLDPSMLVTGVVHHSLQYNILRPPWFRAIPLIAWQAAYLVVIALPLAIAPQKKELGFCIVLVSTAVLSHLFFAHAFASVWCFAAAILSLYLGYVFYKLPPGSSAGSIRHYGR